MSDVGDRADPLPGMLRSRYDLGRLLGSGARSNVYAAHDRVLGRDVAIKLFRAHASSLEVLATQQAEGRLLASMDHHALTRLFDVGLDVSDPEQPRVYLVMEQVHGTDLRRRLTQGALPEEQVRALGADLAEGLLHVHGHGFVHHDVKPANVLLDEHRPDGRVRAKLADLGIAMLLGTHEDDDATNGTAAYLSPELVDGEDATPMSDVYSLGLVLLEALTGRLEYPGGAVESAFARLDRQPRVPSWLPPSLGDLLRAMTARDPAERPGLPAVVAALREQGGSGAPEDAEERRQAVLDRYAILDTPPEDAFDAVIRLTSQILRVPIAIVSIVDRDRVWFKSSCGIDARELDRDVAFCTATDPGRRTAWTVADARADPRLRHNPLVTGEPRVRAYAAAPLITRDGCSLGALCVYDREPRVFQPQELRNLTDLAAVVMRELEMRLAIRRIVLAREQSLAEPVPAGAGYSQPIPSPSRSRLRL